MSWHKFKTQLSKISKDTNHLTDAELSQLIEQVEKVLNSIPDVDAHGRFMADRKIWLSNQILKLQAQRADRIGFNSKIQFRNMEDFQK